METKHLRTFLTIVESASFTRAGRRLGLSQSAISQQLGALERQLETQLLIRTPSGVRPTPDGELLLQYARQILSKVQEAQRRLTERHGSGSGVLRVGTSHAFCECLLPPVLKALRDLFPSLELHIASGDSRRTVRRLLRGDIDVGIVVLPLEAPTLRITEIARDELVVVTAPTHPLATRKRVHAEELANHPFLVQDRSGATFARLERILLEAGVFPRIVMELDDPRALASMARAELGIAIVPRWAVAENVADGHLSALPIGKDGLRRTWGVAVNGNGHNQDAVRTFTNLCSDQLPAMLTV